MAGGQYNPVGPRPIVSTSIVENTIERGLQSIFTFKRVFWPFYFFRIRLRKKCARRFYRPVRLRFETFFFHLPQDDISSRHRHYYIANVLFTVVYPVNEPTAVEAKACLHRVPTQSHRISRVTSNTTKWLLRERRFGAEVYKIMDATIMNRHRTNS